MTVANTDNKTGSGNQTAASTQDGGQAAGSDSKEGQTSKEGQGGEGEGGSLDESTLDPKVQSYISKLRKEAAGYRTKFNAQKTEFDAFREKVSKAVGGEEDELPADKKVEALSAQNQAFATNNAILELAVEHGIPKDGMKYFKFLIAQAVEELEEGQELGEEELKPILAEVRGKFAKASTTSVITTTNKKDPEGSTEISLDKFVSMTMSEKTDLFRKQPELYQSLLDQAKKAKRLI